MFLIVHEVTPVDDADQVSPFIIQIENGQVQASRHTDGAIHDASENVLEDNIHTQRDMNSIKDKPLRGTLPGVHPMRKSNRVTVAECGK
jgi:hypothetical protein